MAVGVSWCYQLDYRNRNTSNSLSNASRTALGYAAVFRETLNVGFRPVQQPQTQTRLGYLAVSPVNMSTKMPFVSARPVDVRMMIDGDLDAVGRQQRKASHLQIIAPDMLQNCEAVCK